MWQSSWVCSVGWDCCTLHSPIHLLMANGGLSLIVVLMGPPPQCSGLYMVIGVIYNILFFGVIHLSLCLEPRRVAPLGGAQHLVLELRTLLPTPRGVSNACASSRSFKPRSTRESAQCPYWIAFRHVMSMGS